MTEEIRHTQYETELDTHNYTSIFGNIQLNT